MLEMFSIGFSAILTPFVLLLIFIGSIVGIIFGAIPGLTGVMAFAVCLPLTFSMTPVAAMAFLCGLYLGSCSGGLISAILLKIPGTISSIATTFDGHPMAEKGEAGKALGLGIFSSFIGGTIGFLMLFFISPPLAKLSIKFSAVEYAAVAFFALTLISSVSGKSIIRGLIGALLGIAFALIGVSSIDGVARLTFGIRKLYSGLNVLPVLLGIYAVTSIYDLAEGIDTEIQGKAYNYKIKGFGFSLKEYFKHYINIIRSSLIGAGIGILPGIGGGTSNILAYIAAQKTSRHPEEFGTGTEDGIIAPECANNASVGGSMIPLLTLGIPGDTVTAILIGALTIHGLTPGPLLFQNNGDLVYAIFASLLVANLMIIISQYAGMRFFVKLLSIPKKYLVPCVIVMCAIGSFCVNNRAFDIVILLFFSLLGYVMKKLDIPFTPFVIGFILGPMFEINFRRALMLSEGSFLPFITKPISLVFLLCAVLSIVFAVINELKKRKEQVHAD